MVESGEREEDEWWIYSGEGEGVVEEMRIQKRWSPQPEIQVAHHPNPPS